MGEVTWVILALFHKWAKRKPGGKWERRLFDLVTPLVIATVLLPVLVIFGLWYLCIFWFVGISLEWLGLLPFKEIAGDLLSLLDGRNELLQVGAILLVGFVGSTVAALGGMIIGWLWSRLR
jgi:hypothetical protein